jgi:hypothetical protein
LSTDLLSISLDKRICKSTEIGSIVIDV